MTSRSLREIIDETHTHTHTHAYTYSHTHAPQVDLRDTFYQLYFGNGFMKYSGTYMIKRSV